MRPFAKACKPSAWLRVGVVFAVLLSSLAALRAQTSFTVTVGNKTGTNPNPGGHSEAYYIDGVEAKELTLTRNVSYTFQMSNVPGMHPFYITQSPAGGGAPAWTTGVTGNFASGNGTLTFTPDNFTPTVLYYQCSNHSRMGWKINISGPQQVLDTFRFKALLSGDNETNVIASRGSGTVEAKLFGDSLIVTGSFTGLGSNVVSGSTDRAHLHIGYAGQDGPVELSLRPTMNDPATSGTFVATQNRFKLTADQKAAIMQRRMYVNIHTRNHPTGEIRGQLVPSTATVYTANLSGRAAFPANNSAGSGRAVVEYYPNGDSIVVTGAFNQLESPRSGVGSRLFIGDADAEGTQLAPLTVTGGGSFGGAFAAASNKFVLTAEQRQAFMAGNTFIRIDTENRPGGEIRGQVVPESAMVFEAWLSSVNETFGLPSTATGGLVAILDGRTLKVAGSFSGLISNLATNIGGGAHLHRGLPGQDGGISYPLTVTPDGLRAGTFTVEGNTFALSPAGVDSLINGQIYANVHSVDRPAGEIRGQLLRATNVVPNVTTILLPEDGSTFEVPTDTAQQFAARWMSATDTNTDAVYYVWQVSSSPDFAPVLFSARATSDTAFSASYGTLLMLLKAAGLDPTVTGSVTLYHRVVTTDGSLTNAGDIFSVTIEADVVEPAPEPMEFAARLAGDNEVPAVQTLARGVLLATLSNDTLRVSGAVTNLSSQVAVNVGGGAHIHMGYAGQNGPVILPLTFTASGNGVTFAESANTFKLTAEQMQALSERRLYANVHTTKYPSGELRGQLHAADARTFATNLSGRAEVPANASMARGGIFAELRNDTLVVTGAFSGLESDLAVNVGGGAHIHTAEPGKNGAVAFPLTVTNGGGRSGEFTAATNTFKLTAEQLDLLEDEGLYANVHSTSHAAGEIRGQLVADSIFILETWLADYNEVPVTGQEAPASTATGGVIAFVDEEELRVAGTFTQLTGTIATDVSGGAHIHTGAVGANGTIVFPLDVTSDDNRSGVFEVANNTHAITEAQRDALIGGGFYVNVHSSEYTAGEIRGQLVPSTNIAPQAPTIEQPAGGTTVTIGNPPTGTIAVDWTAVTDPNGNDVRYFWQFSSNEDFSSGFTMTLTTPDTAVSTTHLLISQVLTLNGIELTPEGTTFYHRVGVTDGNFRTFGATTEVVLRTDVTDVGNEAVAGAGIGARVYPNPARDEATVEVRLTQPARVRIELIDALGRTVGTSTTGTMTAGAHNLTLELDGLESGAYLYRVVAISSAGESTATGVIQVAR